MMKARQSRTTETGRHDPAPSTQHRRCEQRLAGQREVRGWRRPRKDGGEDLGIRDGNGERQRGTRPPPPRRLPPSAPPTAAASTRNARGVETGTGTWMTTHEEDDNDNEEDDHDNDNDREGRATAMGRKGTTATRKGAVARDDKNGDPRAQDDTPRRTRTTD